MATTRTDVDEAVAVAILRLDLRAHERGWHDDHAVESCPRCPAHSD